MTEKYKVLIVDDNEINAMLACELVEAFGLKGITVSSGAEAIEKLRETPVSFILMDHIMPGMDGVEATGIIHGMSSVPIYAMTGDLNERVASEFAAAGAVSAISKPIKPIELLKAIKDCIPEDGYSYTEEMFGKGEMSGNSDIETTGIGEITLQSYMETVSGLNYNVGLSNALGNEEAFFKILKATSNNIRQYVTILGEYLETAEPEKLKLASHSLKTVFANIGFEMLRDESAKIEKYAGGMLKANEGTGQIVSFDDEHQEKISEYISHCMNAALELSDALAGYEQAMESEESSIDYSVIEAPLSVDEMTEVIEYTSKAFERFEIDYVIEGLEYLMKASCNDERKKIEAAIESANSFDYIEAKKAFDEVVALKKGRGEAR